MLFRSTRVVIKSATDGIHRYDIFRIVVFYCGKVAKLSCDCFVRSQKICHIFSHPNPWAWAAECVLGRGDRAMKFYNALCPYYQNDKIEIRESEPYSYCQFIMGKDHTAFGRARHPFMTGSGGWAYFSATRYMLGIRPSFEELSVNPCIPADWKEFSAVRRWRDAEFDIRVENPTGVMKGVKEVFLDGEKVAHIPVQEPGTKHAVVVEIGRASCRERV